MAERKRHRDTEMISEKDRQTTRRSGEKESETDREKKEREGAKRVMHLSGDRWTPYVRTGATGVHREQSLRPSGTKLFRHAIAARSQSYRGAITLRKKRREGQRGE